MKCMKIFNFIKKGDATIDDHTVLCPQKLWLYKTDNRKVPSATIGCIKHAISIYKIY